MLVSVTFPTPLLTCAVKSSPRRSWLPLFLHDIPRLPEFFLQARMWIQLLDYCLFANFSRCTFMPRSPFGESCLRRTGFFVCWSAQVLRCVGTMFRSTVGFRWNRPNEKRIFNPPPQGAAWQVISHVWEP